MPIEEVTGCAGKDTDISGFIYTISIPAAGSYDVIVTWGSSSSYDKSYISWASDSTSHSLQTSNYIVSVEGSDKSDCTASACSDSGMYDGGKTKTYRKVLAAGTQYLYVGGASDSNYYTVPWCRVQVISTP